MNPVSSKIQKIKKSFKSQCLLTADSTFTDIRSDNMMRDSSSVGNLHDRSFLPTPSLSELKPNNQTSLLQKIYMLQDRVERQESSITFYLRQLNRREQSYKENITKMQDNHRQKVEYLERLLQIEVEKNINLQSQLKWLKQINDEDKENCYNPRNKIKNMAMSELGQLVNFVQDELEHRNRSRRNTLKEICQTPRRKDDSIAEESNLLSDCKEYRI